MHRGEQAYAFHARLRKGTPHPFLGVRSRSVEHEEPDEPPGMAGDSRRDRRLVAGDARNERGAVNAVRVEFADPAIGEALRRARIVPLQLEEEARCVRIPATLVRERREERGREEVAVNVVDQSERQSKSQLADALFGLLEIPCVGRRLHEGIERNSGS